jgi:hypothetical protein
LEIKTRRKDTSQFTLLSNLHKLVDSIGDHVGFNLHVSGYPISDYDYLNTLIRQNEVNDTPLLGIINGTNIGHLGTQGSNAVVLSDGGPHNMSNWHNMRIVKNSSVITFFVDENQIYQESLPGSLSGGTIALAGYSNGGGTYEFDNISISIVPEPISSTLFLVGGATLGFRRFRKKFRK